MFYHKKFCLFPFVAICLFASSVLADSGVHGRIFGQSGDAKAAPQTVANATIEFLGPTGQVVAEVTSSDSGYFRVDVPQGAYTYRVHAEGYQSQNGERGVSVRNPEHLAVYNITLARENKDNAVDDDPVEPAVPTVDPGTVYGKVFYTTDQGEQIGIADASVSFGGPGDLAMLSMVDTAKDDPEFSRGAGNYTIDLSPGRYTAVASAKGFERHEAAKKIEVESGQPTVVDFELFPAASPTQAQGIHARVLMRGPSPEDYGNLHVAAFNLSDPSRPIAMVPIDPQTWSMNLPVGHYRVVAFADGFDRALSDPIEVLAGRYSRTDLILRRVTPPAAPPDQIAGQGITGTVTFDPSPSDSSAASVLMGQVEIRIGSTITRTTTKVMPDALGNFKFEAAPGQYRVVASAEDWKAAGEGVTVSAGQYAKLNLTLRRTSTPGDPSPPSDPTSVTLVEVTVREPSGPRGAGQPVAGVTVIAHGNAALISDSPRSTTDADGIAKFRLRTGGMHMIVGQKAGYASAGKRLQLKEGEKHSVELFLSRESTEERPVIPIPDRPTVPTKPDPSNQLANLVVHVLATGTEQNRPRPLYGAEVMLQVGDRLVNSARSDAQGRVLLSVPPGSYQLTTRLAGFDSEQSMIRLSDPTTTTVVYLRRESLGNRPPVTPTPPAEPIRPPVMPTTQVNIQVGGVTPAQGNQVQLLSGARVTLRLGGKVVGSGITSSNGLTTNQLAPNQYQLIVERPGYTTKTESLVVGRQTINHRVLLTGATMPTRPPTEPSIPNPPVPPDSKFVTLSVQAGGVSPSTGNRVALLEGASVVIRNRGQTVALGTTNRDGIFSARIEPGTLEISVTHPDYTSQTDRFVLGVSSASHRILLRAAQQSPPPRPSVTPPVTMPGAVRNPTLTIQVGGKDPGGSNQVTLLGAANVTIVSSNQVRARGVSAAGGVYSAELPPGQYELQISHPGYYDQKSTVTLQSASTTHRVLLNPRRKID